ncbi:hypothetical protein JVU11DRAFT_6629 [Chiua virens]|nr:hypothetical protein JVU11DRAFT_6629 [Chiua virens]
MFWVITTQTITRTRGLITTSHDRVISTCSSVDRSNESGGFFIKRHASPSQTVTAWFRFDRGLRGEINEIFEHHHAGGDYKHKIYSPAPNFSRSSSVSFLLTATSRLDTATGRMSSGAAPPPVEDICGPYLFAALLATAFYSLMCMQTFRYFVLYQKDRLLLKVLVAFVWVVNTLHEGMTISTAYKQIIGLRNPHAYLNGHPEIFFKPLLTVCILLCSQQPADTTQALVAVPVQGFFAYRIFLRSREEKFSGASLMGKGSAHTRDHSFTKRLAAVYLRGAPDW